MQKKPPLPRTPPPELHIQPGQAILLDLARQSFAVANDSALARKLSIDTSTISRVRNRLRPMGSSLFLCIHEATALPVTQLRLIAQSTPEPALPSLYRESRRPGRRAPKD